MRRSIALLVLLAGCTGSEVGNPPFEPEPETDPGVDPTGLSIVIDPVMRGTALQADAGSLAAGTTRVFVTNLETTDPIEVATPDGGGMASAGLVLRTDGEVRLQVEVDAVRRAPFDVVVEAGPIVVPAQRALADCLLLEARDFVVDEAGVDVRVLNRCTEDVAFAPLRTRLSSPAFELAGELTSLAPNEQTTVLVVATGVDGPPEDVLFLEATAPASDRRPITVRLADSR